MNVLTELAEEVPEVTLGSADFAVSPASAQAGECTVGEGATEVTVTFPVGFSEEGEYELLAVFKGPSDAVHYVSEVVSGNGTFSATLPLAEFGTSAVGEWTVELYVNGEFAGAISFDVKGEPAQVSPPEGAEDVVQPVLISTEALPFIAAAIITVVGAAVAVKRLRRRKPEALPRVPMVRFCPMCGAKLEPGAKFCTECGVKV